MLLIVVAGVNSYITLPRESAPDVSIPMILVNTMYEGVSPEDVESSVTTKIEKELAGLKGLKELRSSSAEGMSMVIVEFMPDIIIEDALQYVRDRVDLAELPIDAEEPFVKEINIAEMPIILVSISGDLSPVRLKAIADEVEDAIEQVPGVLNVDVLGALEREIRVEIDPDRVTSYGLTVGSLLGLVPSENVNISAGGLDTEGVRFNVRVPAEFTDPAEIDKLLLTVRDGRPIFLSDVATLTDTFKDRVTYSRLDRADSITVSVQKRVGANIIHISDAVREIVKQADARTPKGVEIRITLDVAKYIRMMVSDLENNILSGLLLVVLVLLLFLGFRTSAIVALAIPSSMLISFAVIQGLGYTLNMIVLFSLVLALGMLVDNAIVIVENIYRHLQLGYGRVDAAIKGTREVAWPVTTSTATTVAAFSPMIFWPDIMGDFMKYLPITVIISLISSLFVALIISPTVCSLVASGKAKKDKGDHWFVRGYARLLEVSIKYGYATLALSVLLLVALVVIYGQYGRGVEFFPESDPDRAVINIRCPQGTSLQESDRLTRIVEERLEPFGGDLEHIVSNVGSSGGGNPIFGGGSSGPHVGNLSLIFHDYEVRKRPSAAAIPEMRAAMRGIPGAEIKVEKEDDGPPTGAAVTVRIAGEDFSELERLSAEARGRIVSVPGLVNLRSDLEASRPELVFHVDRQRAMLLGVSTAMIGSFLKTAIFGNKVGTYRQFNDEYDITIRLPRSERVNIDDLFRLRIPNTEGRPVPLSSLGRFDYQGGFGTINRVDQKRVVTLTADAEGRFSTEVLADAQARLADLEIRPGYSLSYAGEKEEQDKARIFLTKAFAIACILIVLILVTQFNSFKVPFIIMTTVLLSLVGVLWGLLVCGKPFGIIMTGIGVISLAGVVVNNAIVLLDYTRQLERRGIELVEAALTAGKTRLRPVLLTATTTILGLIPMATGVSFNFRTMELITRSQSSEWWKGMAIAVIFGLAFATVLTLIVVPALYVMITRMARWGSIAVSQVLSYLGLGDAPGDADVPPDVPPDAPGAEPQSE